MGQVWAVARNLLVEVWRIRALVVFLVLALGSCTLGMAWWLHVSEGPGDHKVQTFLSYSLSFSGTILALLTIFLSVGSVTRDIQRREIFTVATKPITRGQFLAGKVVGLAVLNLMLLGLVGGVVYGATLIMSRTEPRDVDERRRLDELVLTSRASVEPVLAEVDSVDLEREIQRITEQRMEAARAEMEDATAAQIEAMRTTVRKEVANQLTLQYRSAPPGGHVVWHFTGVRPDPEAESPVYIRYQLEPAPTPEDLKVFGQWFMGSDREALYTATGLLTHDTVRTVIEKPLPGGVLTDTGEFFVIFRNPPENYPTRIIFPLPEGEEVSIEALYVTGGFTSNYLRGLASLYMRLVFLGLFGVAMGAWLSFPVAVLVTMIVFTLGIASEFILSAVQWSLGRDAASLTSVLVQVLPRLAAYDPVESIQDGRLVSYGLLGRQLGMLVVLKGGLVSLFGYLVFRFRELARVTV